MEELPLELQEAIRGLERDYQAFEFHPVGANGYLVFAENRISGAEVAIKFYSGAPGERRHDEPRLLASIQSPNVLQIIDARNLSEEWAFFLTPRCRGGNLDNFIADQPSVFQSIDVAIGICNGASAIHARGLIHRDFKPENIVCEGGVPLIADFGSVRQLIEGEIDLPASGHSALYRPPESFKTSRYSIQGDVYQVGIVTYQLLGGQLSYNGLDYFTAADHRRYAQVENDFDRSRFVDDVIHRRAARGNLLNMKSLPPWVGTGAKNALRRMTSPDLNVRMTNMADVAAILTQQRADMADWRWVGDVARLERDGRTVEFRPRGANRYEPLQARAGAFRRIPGMADGTLEELVRQLG